MEPVTITIRIHHCHSPKFQRQLKARFNKAYKAACLPPYFRSEADVEAAKKELAFWMPFSTFLTVPYHARKRNRS